MECTALPVMFFFLPRIPNDGGSPGIPAPPTGFVGRDIGDGFAISAWKALETKFKIAISSCLNIPSALSAIMANRWNRRNRGPTAQRVPDSILLTGVKQGAARAVTVPFGSKRRSRRKGSRKGSASCGPKVWDAFHPSHLSLPRAVAPYTVVRTTAIWQQSDTATEDFSNRRKFVLFGPVHRESADDGCWTNGYAIGSNKALDTLRSEASGACGYAFGSIAATNGAWKASSITPAAFSIQVMNPEALQSSKGMVYIGRCHNKVHLSAGDISTSWEVLAQELVAYSEPRICSAAKLALRGVQVDAVPNNMNKLSEFSTVSNYLSGSLTTQPTTISANYNYMQDGFNPIFIYNPSGVDLQILVCCEWRVRFDPSNPAYSACTSHPPSSDRTWWNTMEDSVKLGNGVVDIATKVAALGSALA